jgi:triacylglycerol lipase
MIVDYRMHDRVASLGTISTPHWGTSFADWGIRHLGRAIDIAARWGLDIEGFRDLTRASCRAFNEASEDFELTNGVKYRTWAGVQDEDEVFAPLRFPWGIIDKEEGPSDGLVSLESARWRDDFFVRAIDADHRNEIGWCDLGDLASEATARRFEDRIAAFYAEIAEEITHDS